MGRQAVGCGFSTSREDAIAIIGNMYGLDSPEGQGVMSGYITGTLLGTIFNGLMASLFCSLGFFHPYSLAIGCSSWFLFYDGRLYGRYCRSISSIC